MDQKGTAVVIWINLQWLARTCKTYLDLEENHLPFPLHSYTHSQNDVNRCNSSDVPMHLTVSSDETPRTKRHFCD